MRGVSAASGFQIKTCFHYCPEIKNAPVMEIMFCQIFKHIIPFMVALLVLQSETGIQFLFGNLDFFRGHVL